jgi:hypothetical protein
MSSDGSYFKLKSTFHTGSTGRALRKLDAEVFKVAVYLMSNDAANRYGVYHIEQVMICAQTGLTPGNVAKALETLQNLGYSFYDDDTSYVFVKEMAAHQLDAPLKAVDARVQMAKRWYVRFPMNVWLGAFYDRYFEDLRLGLDPDPVERRTHPRETMEGPVEAPSGGLGTGTGAVQSGLDLGLDVRAPARAKETREQWLKRRFDEFMKAYPKGDGRMPAYSQWCRIKGLDDALADAIVAAVEAQKPHFNYAESGRYVPRPDTWLSQQRWNDTRKPLPSMSSRTQQNLRAAANFARGTQ